MIGMLTDRCGVLIVDEVLSRAESYLKPKTIEEWMG